MQLYDLFVAAGAMAPVPRGTPAAAAATAPTGPRANFHLDEDATESE